MEKLSMCKENDVAVVLRIEGSGAFKKRMIEMGILKGTEIKIIKYAPLKDPMEVVLKGYHLTLRVEEADRVLVEKTLSDNAESA